MTGPLDMRCAAALLTPRGRGAVAVILLRGQPLLPAEMFGDCFHPANGKPETLRIAGRLVYGTWGASPPREEVLVVRRTAMEVEIHCHGGTAAAGRILEDLRTRGFSITTARALHEAQAGFLATETAEALTQALTLRTAGHLLDQEQGAFSRAARALSAIPWTAAGRAAALLELEELLRWAPLGLHLTQPWRVVLYGRPNVGKSSLMNALLGFSRAIVLDQPGTTRDVVRGETAYSGWPVQLADTAGFRNEAGGLEAAGIDRARDALADADVRILVLDGSLPLKPADVQFWEEIPPTLIVLNKADLPRAGGTVPVGCQNVSAATGNGISDLWQAVIARLVPEVPPPGTPLPVTSRQVAALRAARAACVAEDQAEWNAAWQALFTGVRHDAG